MGVIVAITVSFDLLHPGHKDHIEKASKLGDRLIVMVQPGHALVNKRGCEVLDYKDRLILAEMIKWLNPDNQVVEVIDTDGTCVETLRELKPDIYAKGGDRTPDNMVQAEIDVCEEIRCEIVYGVGDLLNSSTDMFMNAMKKFQGLEKVK